MNNNKWYVIKRRGHYSAINYKPACKVRHEANTQAGAIQWIESREQLVSRHKRLGLDLLGASAFVAALVILYSVA